MTRLGADVLAGQDPPRGARPLVSVVMATYNLERYVADAVRSVLSQTIADLELHVVDDGSTDGTRAALEPFASDPRFHYYQQPNAGQTVAKNNGLKRCTGRFVAFLDGDDLWPLNRIESQLSAFSADAELGIAYGRVITIDADGNVLSGEGYDYDPARRHSGRITEQLFADNFIAFGAVLVRRECFETLGGFDESLRMGIDWDLWLRFSTRYRFRYLDDVALIYREWSGQMSKNWRGRYEQAFTIMGKFMRNFPDALDGSAVRRAKAAALVGRARIRAYSGHQRGRAIADCLRAIAIRPTYGVAYKSLARIGLSFIGLTRLKP